MRFSFINTQTLILSQQIFFSIMEKPLLSKICEKHQQQCIGVDSNPLCEIETRHCCELCLNIPKQSRDFVTYNNAISCLEKVKKEFFQRREKQCTRNVDTLKNVSNGIIHLKSYFNKSLEDLLEVVNKQIVLVEKQYEAVQKSYGSLDLDQFFNLKIDVKEELNFHKFCQNLKESLDEIMKKRNLEAILSQLKQLDNSFIKIGRIHSPYQVLENEFYTQKLNLKCPKHKKDIKVFDINNNVAREERILCEECLNDRIGRFNSQAVILEKWLDYEKYKKEYSQLGTNVSIKKDQLLVSLQVVQKNFNEELETIIQNISFEFSNLSEKNEDELKSISREWQTLLADEILDRLEILGQQPLKDLVQSFYFQLFTKFGQFMFEQVKDLLQKFKQISNSFIQQFQNNKGNQETLNNNAEVQVSTPLQSVNLWFCSLQQRKVYSKNLNIQAWFNQQSIPINYQPVDNYFQYLKYNNCQALAVNKGQTIVVAAFEKWIKIYKFEQGKLTEQEQLNSHKETIGAVAFFENSDNFVSADVTIIQWFKNYQGKWADSQIREKAHSQKIQCLQVFGDDNKIASCSRDGYLKIWKKKYQGSWEIHQELKQENAQLYSMSLNASQQQLVVCGWNNSYFGYQGIIIFYKLVKEQWISDKVQYYDQFINSISFPGEEDIILFQKQSDCKINILQYQASSKDYVIQECKTITVINQNNGDFDESFHQIYNEKKKILIKRHGNFIYVIKKLKDGQFMIAQSIDFLTRQIVGTLTNDGKFLITWDNRNNKLAVRKQS